MEAKPQVQQKVLALQPLYRALKNGQKYYYKKMPAPEKQTKYMMSLPSKNQAFKMVAIRGNMKTK